MAQFEVLYLLSPGGTERDKKNPQSGQIISGPRCKLLFLRLRTLFSYFNAINNSLTSAVFQNCEPVQLEHLCDNEKLKPYSNWFN